jgi:lactoylglutathione lyase
MEFTWCTITVKDMEKSLAFYRDIVGLPVVRRLSGGLGPEIAFLGAGETKVELIHDTGQAADHPKGISLGFAVESLDAMIAFLEEQGIPIAGGPYQPSPHIRFIFVKDPDGVTVQFAESL